MSTARPTHRAIPGVDAEASRAPLRDLQERRPPEVLGYWCWDRLTAEQRAWLQRKNNPR
jgi:hypothetical protein